MARATKKPASKARSKPKAQRAASKTAAKEPVAKKPAKAAKGAAKKPAKKAVAKKAAKKKASKATPAPKAAPAKPVATPAAPAKPKKKVKAEVNARDIRKIHEALLGQRQTLLKEYADLEEGSLLSQSEASGEVSFDEEYADAGSYTFEREKELSIGNNIRDLLDKVETALRKIEQGTYGICDNCGNPIARARVLALPHSSLCLSCKQLEERTR